MKPSYSLALAGFAAALASSTAAFAQVPLVGGQCRPAIANASQYQNCRVRIVAGSEVCRCEILPQAIRRGAVVGDNQESDRNEFARFDRVGSNQAAGTLSATGAMQSGATMGASNNTMRSGTNATAPVTQTTAAQAAAGAGMNAGTQTNTTARPGTVVSTDVTAGTGMGNPGNGMTVGRAGETPNGRDFGAGTRGRGDVVRGDTNTDTTDTAKAERKAERQAEKVERKAEKAETKEQARAERAAAKAERQEMTEVEETTRERNRTPRSGVTAGTGTGNPGNGMMVGRAGENPNGKGFGEGTRGRSDVSRTTTGGTSGSPSQAELRMIVQELRRGTTIDAILDRFDISRQELRQIAQDNGIKNFGQVRSEVNQIARDLRNGVSVSTILGRYGLTLEQLKEFAERNDLEDVLERISTVTGSTAKSTTKEADKAARGSKKSMDDDSMNSSMPDMGRSNRSGATAGTGVGNPGNGMSVGRAGENPNGKGFGDGTRGRSDVDTTGSTTGSTSDTSSGGSQGGGQGGQGAGQGSGGNQGNGGGQGNGGQGSGGQGNGGGQGGGQGNGGGDGGRGK